MKNSVEVILVPEDQTAEEEAESEEEVVAELEEQLGSSLTLERVAAAKKFIESHYKSHMKHIQERKERRSVLERKLAGSGVPEEEQLNLLKDLERKETEYIRLKRHKICVDDFELLTVIGRGAFGEVDSKPSRTGSGPLRKMLLTPQDLSFVGYTYKNFEAVKGLSRPLVSRASAPAGLLSSSSILGVSSGDFSAKTGTGDQGTLIHSSSADPLEKT